MNRINEIIERRNQIATELESETADLGSLETELNALDIEEKELRSIVERRSNLLSRVNAHGTPIEIRGGAAGMPPVVQETFTLESPEYRSAFFNNLAGNQLSEVEQRALSVEGFAGALPTATADRIYSLIQRDHSLLQDIDVFSLGSLFEITVIKSVKAGKAKSMKENTANVEMTFNKAKYTLSGKDYSDWTEISYAMGTMNGQDLENFLVTELYDSIGDAIAEELITMIKADVHADNKVTLPEVTFKELSKLFGKIKHKGEIKTYLNNSSLYEHLVSMVDKEDRPIFQPNANIKAEGAFVGSTLRTESAVADNELVIGVPKAIVGNWVTKPFIQRDNDIKANKHVFSAYGRFEGKLRNDLAFVVITITPAVGG